MVPDGLEIRYYRVDGDSPFRVWFLELDARAATRVALVLERMEAGNLSEVKSVGGGVFERRIDFGPGYRVYFGRDGEHIVVLLGGGTKVRQQRDIVAAKIRWNDYKGRKTGAQR
ncbi:MAG TPA: type II toxin-antitoxin system RelE/ParE family toxin [Caulobacteraceae bacterium]|jgi:putative addiction module killer protein